jgi:transcriptional regulator of acetoin/glycerol metabolism
MATTPPADARPTQRTDQTTLARTRERFLTADPIETGAVRDAILASWWRSRRWNVAPDHVRMQYRHDTDLDTPLARSAMPVLRNLLEHLDGQPISVILTDAKGLVLTRLTADKALEQRLERVQLAPGFSYAEEFVGTNGIGTALEGGRPTHVFGHEHYAENLESLACAAVPIQDPISGKTVGAVDLTCWRKDAGQLLIALAKTTSDQIRQALLMDGGEREYRLLQAYLKACRRSNGIVLALNGDVVMSNDQAQLVLEPVDRSALLQHAADALAAGETGAVSVELPSGGSARLRCRPVSADDRGAGAVAHVQLVDPESSATAVRPARSPRIVLPGLVGSGSLWVRACQQVDAAHESGEWFVVDGEPGVGKLSVVRGVHHRRSPAVGFHVLDTRDADAPTWLDAVARELAGSRGTLVLRHVDELSGEPLRGLTAVLAQARESGPTARVVATSTARTPDPDLSALLAHFPRSLTVPPLHHHVEDLHELVPFLLGRLQDNGLTCSSGAMQILIRFTWPGNVAQLVRVLRRVVRTRRSGVVEPDDLPPECRTVTRRVLSPIEALERDAIVRSLIDSNGNKAVAAQGLGISRATIYRKIHDYGIVTTAARTGS